MGGMIGPGRFTRLRVGKSDAVPLLVESATDGASTR